MFVTLFLQHKVMYSLANCQIILQNSFNMIKLFCLWLQFVGIKSFDGKSIII